VERSASEQRPPSRSEARDAAARAALVPLREGERPVAVTVGAVVVSLLALLELVAFAAGAKVDGKAPRVQLVLPFVVGSVALAWGLWRTRYWAVLALQAVLAFAIVIFSVLLLIASNLAAVLVTVAVIGAAGTLFWFLVKAMARMQMPERQP
jgi:hypothetical protein